MEHYQPTQFEALVLDKLTNLIPSRPVATSIWKELKNIKLADPRFDIPGSIDVLLGADVYAGIILDGIRKLSMGPLLQKFKLGWIISGEVNQNTVESYRSFKVEIKDEITLREQLEKFWRLEELPSRRPLSKEETDCETHYKDNVTRQDDGRYMVRLPFKPEAKKTLGCSKSNALTTYQHLERRLDKNIELKTAYTSCFNEYLELGYMQKVADVKEYHYDNGHRICDAHYLPHHAVFKESTTTKLRVVFDASRKTSTGYSLNDVLMTGPAIQNDMLDLLLRWRFHKFVFVADITKMFLQVKMHPKDANFQRIFWRPNTNSNILEYRLNTVTFGLTSAPFLAIRTLHQLADDTKETNPSVFKSIIEDFYVDDLLSGGMDLEETINRRKEISTVLETAGFKLRKWVANDVKLLEGISSDDIELKYPLDMNLDQGIKSLGVVWHPITDQFSYRFKLESNNTTCTKRELLSKIARLYDPMGWLAPVIITPKMLLQSLWLIGTGWDDTLPAEINVQWLKFKDQLDEIQNIRIPRWLHIDNNPKIELHGFSDASLTAYAAAAYLVIRYPSNTYVRLLMAKSKVSPVNSVCVARLELCGAVLLAKLIHKIKESSKVFNVPTWLWCDNTTVLAWLEEPPIRWTVFVANRTSEILSLVGNIQWRYVLSKENPADLATRGVEPGALTNCHLWWMGPHWLKLDPINWPYMIDIEPTEKERRKCVTVTFSQQAADLDDIIARYSTLTRLIRVTAYCFRIYRLASKLDVHKTHLTTTELDNAFLFWIRFTQRKEFEAEIEDLSSGRPISKRSKIRNLVPILKKGVLRVGGRLQNASMSDDETHPIIIPNKGKLTELILNQTHMATQHGQTQLMLAVLRRRFWPIDGRNTVKNCIHKCVRCFKAKAATSNQLMGNLPKPRVTISRPFTHTGIDYCGPFDIKDRRGRGCRLHKGYVAIFVCLAVKAILIELVSDMSTQGFLAAFRRFTGRRGLCSHVYSDCGSNFIGADAALRKIVDENRATEELMANEGVKWHFIPPASPHFGGLWEAGVKSLKMHLRRVVGNSALTFEEFATTLVQIEACLNSRPLCPLNDDPTDLTPLTPAHFLIGDTLLALPESDLQEERINRLDRWQFTQRLTQNFWRRWKGEYLSRLQERPKWLSKNINVKVGELCLIKDDKSASYKWPLGRITEVHPGADGLVRVVTVRTEKTVLKRPVTKIAILPIE